MLTRCAYAYSISVSVLTQHLFVLQVRSTITIVRTINHTFY